jgi:acyl-CoA thioesterase-1
VKNAGVSGDTSSGGLSRFNWVLSEEKPDLVIIEFGANDMMRDIDPKITLSNIQSQNRIWAISRGIDPKITLSNMDKMLRILSQKNIKTIIAGMAAFPNLGDEYADEFNKIYPSLAKKYCMNLYPFFLKDVAAVAKFNQADSVHPNKKAVAVITKNIMPLVIESLSN